MARPRITSTGAVALVIGSDAASSFMRLLPMGSSAGALGEGPRGLRVRAPLAVRRRGEDLAAAHEPCELGASAGVVERGSAPCGVLLDRVFGEVDVLAPG